MDVDFTHIQTDRQKTRLVIQRLDPSCYGVASSKNGVNLLLGPFHVQTHARVRPSTRCFVSEAEAVINDPSFFTGAHAVGTNAVHVLKISSSFSRGRHASETCFSTSDPKQSPSAHLPRACARHTPLKQRSHPDPRSSPRHTSVKRAYPPRLSGLSQAS